MEGHTQIGIENELKDRLDEFKVENKNDILTKYSKDKRFVTNTLAIRYLLDISKKVKK